LPEELSFPAASTAVTFQYSFVPELPWLKLYDVVVNVMGKAELNKVVESLW
jgi:hypothetical protein